MLLAKDWPVTGAGRATVAFHGSTAWGEVHLESSVHAQRLLFLKPSANWLVMIRHLVLGGERQAAASVAIAGLSNTQTTRRRRLLEVASLGWKGMGPKAGCRVKGDEMKHTTMMGGSRKRLRDGDGDGDGDDGGNGGEDGRTAATVTAARFSTGSNDSSDNDDGSDDDGGSLGGFYPIGSKRRSRSNSGLAPGF